MDRTKLATYTAKGEKSCKCSRCGATEKQVLPIVPKSSTKGKKVAKISIKGAKVVLTKAAFTYNGKVQRPSIKTIGGKKLKVGTDYTIKWSNKSSKNVGPYTVTITGKGKYAGVVKVTYKIPLIHSNHMKSKK